MEIKEFDERFAYFTPEKDIEYLSHAIKICEKAVEEGNFPFGAILVDNKGNVLMEQGNVQNTENDLTAHAETALARKASATYSTDFLWNCTMYSSFEPCCMCTGAVYWTNIGRIVYAASEADLLAVTGDNEDNPTFEIDCRSILERGQKDIVVRGPIREVRNDAMAIHLNYWK